MCFISLIKGGLCLLISGTVNNGPVFLQRALIRKYLES